MLGWILAALLAVAFFGAGFTKLTSSRDKLLANPQMAWASDFTAGQIKVISALEVLGAIGVVLPWLLNVAPVLSPISALGCAALMVGAALVHLRRRELRSLPPAVVLCALAVAVAVVRFSQL